MPDYRIYLINGTGNSSFGENTKPFSQRDNYSSNTSTEDTKTKKTAENIIVTAAHRLQNPDSLITSAINKFTDAIPFFAAAKAVVGLGDSVVTTVMSFYTIATGNYAGQRAYSNFKTILMSNFHPISNYISYNKELLRAEINQLKVNQEIALLGDSVINNGKAEL